MAPTDYLDAVLQLPWIYRPWVQVSRDGKWIAWTWLGATEGAEVYAAPTDGSSAPLRLTETPQNTILMSWTPDDRSVLVFQDHDGDERYQIFRIELANPRILIPLTEAQPPYYLRGADLHPNGRWLVYGANYDFDAQRVLEPTWVYRHDLATGERRVLARPAKTSFFRPRLAPTGSHVVYPRAEQHPAGRQMWLADIDGKTDREILNAGADKHTAASWFPDGKRLVVLADTTTHTKLGVYDLERDAVQWLIDDPERTIQEAYVPFGSEQIVVITVQGARASSSLLDPETGVEVAFPHVRGNLYPLAPLAEKEWVGFYASSTQPDDLVRFATDDTAPEKFVSLTRLRDATPLREHDFVAAEDFRWNSDDGLEIQGWLYRAQNPRGTVVYVHGGPTYHHEDRIESEIAFYVRSGFNVLDPNYRGSTGFGLAYREAIKKEGWGGPEQQDIRTGIEALQRAGIAEKGRVGITGTSYGGYSAWYAITHFSTDIVAAAAPICGMTDLVIDYETTRPDLRPYSEEMMGGTPAQIPAKYRERSPIHFVQNIRGELLIVQGMQDPNVTPENVRAVTQKLQEAGVEYQVLAFEDEGHGIYKPKNMKILCTRLVDFFAAAFRT